jgi:hypothetical protein
MGVTVLKQEYKTQFKPSSTTNWLLGNVGDWQKLTLECEFVVEKFFSATDTITFDDPNRLILNGGQTWNELGFDVGMSCNIFYYVRVWTAGVPALFSNNIPFVITAIIGNTLEAQKPSGAPFTSWGYQYGAIAPTTDTLRLRTNNK